MQERLYLFVSLSGYQTLASVLYLSEFLFFHLGFYSALLTFTCPSDCPHHKAFRKLNFMLLIPPLLKTVFKQFALLYL